MQRRVFLKSINDFDFGNALISDGIDDFVSGVNITGTNLSFNFWIKPIAGDYFSGNNSNYQIRLRSASIVVGSNFISAPLYNINGSPYMVSIVYNGSVNQIYINGVLQSSTSSYIDISTTTLLQRSDFNGSRYQCKLNEFAAWDGYVFTQTDITNLYNSGNGELATSVKPSPIRYYRCNQSNGDTLLIDETGNQDGTLNNFSGTYFDTW